MTDEEIRDGIARVRERERLAKLALKDDLKNMRAEVAAIQKKCPHRSVYICMGTPYDPSVKVCTVCGRELA